MGSGSGSIRQTLPPTGSATQTAPAPTASAVRLSAATGIRFEAAFVRGSISTTSPPSLRIHTSPSPAAMLDARTPATPATTRFVRGSIRETLRSGLTTQTAASVTAMCGLRLSCPTQMRAGPLARDRGIVSSTTADSGPNRDTLSGSAVLAWRTPFPIQIAPAPAARSVGVEPVLNVRTTARSFGSICETVLSSASSTQTLPSPTAMLVGAVPRGMVARSSPVLGSSTPALPPAIVCSLPSTVSLPPSRTSRTATAPTAAARRRAPARTSSRARRRAGLGPGLRAGAASSGSCSRIWRSSRCSPWLGSKPSSSARARRNSW